MDAAAAGRHPFIHPEVSQNETPVDLYEVNILLADMGLYVKDATLFRFADDTSSATITSF